MDDHSKSVRRTGRIGEGEDDVVSIQDILDEEKRLEADASAVLGASDPVNCTYPKGYLNRQALYACATCTPNGNAGICLACSYACHEGHDLYELYTKRHFCCDCGNDKFPNNECKLIKNKKLNSRNRYNHNFTGLYCSCSRPYPDVDDSIGDEMIQCIMCEDWLHGRHLNTDTPDGDEFVEMICTECMSKNPFLWAYYVASKCDVVSTETTSNPNVDVDEHTNTTEKETKTEDHQISSNSPSQQIEILPQSSNIPPADKKDVSVEDDASDKENHETDGIVVKEQTSNSGGEIPSTSTSEDNSSSTSSAANVSTKRKMEDTSNCENEEDIKSPKKPKIEKESEVKSEEEATCLLQSLKQREYETFEHAAFWRDGWRSKLCKCQDCLEMYKDKEIEFLIDESDTVDAYEESGKDNEAQEAEPQGVEENLLAGMQGMHRVQQIEIARGVRNLQTELTEFLNGFHREGKVVTEEAVREFFQSLEEKRRRRLNLPQNNCR